MTDPILDKLLTAEARRRGIQPHQVAAAMAVDDAQVRSLVNDFRRGPSVMSSPVDFDGRGTSNVAITREQQRLWAAENAANDAAIDAYIAEICASFGNAEAAERWRELNPRDRVRDKLIQRNLDTMAERRAAY
jgi:hypothetical protein